MELIDKDKLKEFIEHWYLIITPYDETKPDHKAIKTVITELRSFIEAFTIPNGLIPPSTCKYVEIKSDKNFEGFDSEKEWDEEKKRP